MQSKKVIVKNVLQPIQIGSEKFDVTVPIDLATRSTYDIEVNCPFNVRRLEIIQNYSFVNPDGTDVLYNIYSSLVNDFIGTIGGSSFYDSGLFYHGHTSGTDNAYVVEQINKFNVYEHQIRLEPVSASAALSGYLTLSFVCYR